MEKTAKILSLALIAIAFSTAVGAKTLKIATLAPAGTTWMKVMKASSKLIAQRTEGRWE